MDASDIAVQVLSLNDEHYCESVAFGHCGLLTLFSKLSLCITVPKG